MFLPLAPIVFFLTRKEGLPVLESAVASLIAVGLVCCLVGLISMLSGIVLVKRVPLTANHLIRVGAVMGYGFYGPFLAMIILYSLGMLSYA